MKFSKLPLIIGTILITAMSSCNKKDEASEVSVSEADTRYELVDRIVKQYSKLLLATPPDGMEMEKLLMDINSRSEMLMAAGDTLTALYFHHAIERSVREQDNAFANRIFGECPYTAFNL